MPITYCNKCKTSHPRSMGKKCTRYLELNHTAEDATSPHQLFMDAVQGLQGTRKGVLDCISSLENPRLRSPSPSQDQSPEYTEPTRETPTASQLGSQGLSKTFGSTVDTAVEDAPAGGKNLNSSRKFSRTHTIKDLIVNMCTGHILGSTRDQL